MYVLTTNGVVSKFPYTLTDMRFDNPQVSFPVEITDAVAADFGVYPVQETTPPAYQYATQNLVMGVAKQGADYVQTWTVNPASNEEKAQRQAGQEAGVRAQRDQLLHDKVDTFNAIRWENMSEQDRQPWRDYRQNLLDVPQQSGFPWDVVWPTAPGE